MRYTLRLGRIFGIDIGVHLSWLVVFALLTGTLARSILPEWYPDWSTAAYWLTSIVASLLFFCSLLAHELGHSLVARARGIPVSSITLFVLGGIAGLSREPDTAGDEFLMAIAGPAVSLVLAVVSFVVVYLTPARTEHLNAVLFYLAVANGVLVIFNLIPGFPLDGGRVLHSLIWRLTHSLNRATRIASIIGVVVGVLFMIAGLYEMIADVALSGLWLLAIGWFLQRLAREAYRSTRPPRPAPYLRSPEPPVASPLETPSQD